MYKHVAARPEWLGSPEVEDVYSISACISDRFTDVLDRPEYNGYGLFDSPAIMEDLAAELEVSLEGLTLFYYEAYKEEFNDETKVWSVYKPGDFAPVSVSRTNSGHLEGYDVANFSMGPTPECSPLSCSGLAREIKVNRHCLFDTFDAARDALVSGKFDDSEPGPFRIFAVYTLDPKLRAE